MKRPLSALPFVFVFTAGMSMTLTYPKSCVFITGDDNSHDSLTQTISELDNFVLIS